MLAALASGWTSAAVAADGGEARYFLPEPGYTFHSQNVTFYFLRQDRGISAEGASPQPLGLSIIDLWPRHPSQALRSCLGIPQLHSLDYILFCQIHFYKTKIVKFTRIEILL